jgi:membrane AbrB-like protein
VGRIYHQAGAQPTPPEGPEDPAAVRSGWRSIGLVLLLAVAGGMAANLAQLPAGALIGSMAAVGAYNLWTDGAARMPAAARDASRIVVGAVIGSLVTPSLLHTFGANLVWALAVTALVILVGVACGLLLTRISGLDRATALLSCSPGGISEMAALAEDVGARADVVVGVHLVRKLLALAAIAITVALVGGS